MLELIGLHAHEIAEQRERRGDNLGNKVDQRTGNYPSVAELRIVEITAYGQIYVDLACRILEQGNRQSQRQTHGARMIDFVTEFEIAQYDVVLASQLAFLDLVIEPEVELATRDFPARKRYRICGELGHLDILEYDSKIGILRRIERCYESRYSHETEFVHLAFQFDVRRFGAARGDRRQGAVQRIDLRVERQWQRLVGEVCRGIPDQHATDRNVHRA